MRLYVVYYKFKVPNEKKPGPVRQFRFYASNLAQAKQLVTQYSNYPDIEVLRIEPAAHL